MIRLFLADIDGCLSEPYVPFDLETFAVLRAWGERAASDPRYPRLGVCSGRSYPYVEAVAQALGLRAPALFESGGGQFHLAEARIVWNPALTPEVEQALAAVRQFMVETIVPRSPTISYDYGKRSQAGIVSPHVGECAAHLDEVRAFTAAEAPALTPYRTPYSIDVVPQALTKAQALGWLAETEGTDPEGVAFIGDTDGDAEAIRTAGLGFAPANGAPEALAAADVVTGGAVLAGVVEAYRECLRRNGVDERTRILP